MLVATSMIVASCHDEKLPIDDEQTSEETSDGDVLVVNITLDKMGGKSTRANSDPLEKLENYVDPEKIRVFVFDDNDDFLFESKSRIIKEYHENDDHLLWSVSIPLYTFGNDREYNWEWSKIREKLTTKDFKIAILANRPDREWNMGILGRTKDGTADLPDKPENYIVPNGWFDNTGPKWDRTNSVVYIGDKKDTKNVFHLHHSQYDPIYHGKNFYTSTNENDLKNRNYNFYGSVARGTDVKPMMGATSSWVDWGNNDEPGDWDNVTGEYGKGKGKNRDDMGWNFRKTKLPSDAHPIPMYGIQQFAPLSGWKKGTTINLNRDEDKAISLLRSVVKLELLIDRKIDIGHVLLFYSNIYARCEPMDVWTPTDQIWFDENNRHDCELELIKSRIGKMAKGSDGTYQDDSDLGVKNSRLEYQRRLTNIYGIWRKDKNWSFDGSGLGLNLDTYFDTKYPDDGYVETKVSGSVENKVRIKKEDRFVRIFNPCIQRNNTVYVEKCNDYDNKSSLSYDEKYAHYVVYTGERNINDPSNLGRIELTGSGNPTIIYWTLVDKKETTATGYKYYKTYSFPIVDYNSASLSNVAYSGFVMIDKETNGKDKKPGNGDSTTPSGASSSNSTGIGTYTKQVHTGSISESSWPLPLLRNHVYRITLTGSGGAKTRSNGEMDFSIQFEEKHTKDIGFPIKKE